MSKDLIKDAKAALPKNASAALKKFLEKFYNSIPGEDRATVNPAVLAQVAQTHLKMSKDRKPGEPRIEIYTPPADEDGQSTGRTVIDLVNDDMAFLVDSVAAEITQHYKMIHILLHPMIHVRRSKNGSFEDIEDKPGEGTVVQSHIHVELQGTLPEPLAKELKLRLLKVLSDVYYATNDWQDMRGKLLLCRDAMQNAPRDKYDHDEINEYLEFLDYLYKDNFTLLGYRQYKFASSGKNVESKTIRGSSLGLLHDDVKPVYISETEDGLPQDLQRLRKNQPPLTVSKVNKRSTVHRPVPLDAIAVKVFDRQGNVVGEELFIGLFTSVTYSRSIHDIPLLSRKTNIVLERSGFKPGSHDHKALRHVLEKYPRDELFQIDIDTLLKTCISILRLQERQRIALYVRPDPFGRYVSCLVYVPRDRYDTRLRLVIQGILEEELKGETGDFYTTLDDSPLARVMFVINISQTKPPKYSISRIEKKLQEAGRLWREKLSDVLMAEMECEEEAVKFSQKYGEAFPVSYRQTYEAKQGLFDIRKIEDVLATKSLALDLYKCKECESSQIRLKVFHADTPMNLSDVLPVLENMGLRVISEMPFEVLPENRKQAVWIHDFMMELNPDIAGADVDQVKALFEEAFVKAWTRDIEDDSLNQLVIGAQMGWREVMILRTYVRYMRQMGYHFGTRYIEQALTKNHVIAGAIVDLFITQNDPDNQKNVESRAAKCLDTIEQELEKVVSLDEDRILRSITDLVKATLRTNFFQHDENGEPKTYLSVKLESGKIADLPRPVPYREIFVFAPRVEGVHLRGDVIARGGIRWSDRHEDFRTEILGLMKAQQVKNSVIVPMGAKGGFVVKHPPAEGGRKAFLEEGIACYKIFIRGLLDITDNRKGRKVVKPKRVICRDGDDPYLVVAADKGTATFSDIANGLSQEYGFWLGDAFASGGSAGYDHKIMGITARGAWESVKRHFRELNHDTQSQPFDVIGVGDMGGDVFGNGMLLSKQIRMVGAFNHLHIFCDPDPDTEVSFKERKRLFKNVKGWGDYNTRLLSKGGRIFLRSEKSLTLTPEIRKRFDIDKEKVSPNELIQAMLRARTDLLWFGGIGTYIKATHESHADVGDKGNDALRINAPEIRARVIGEGANLAVTQAARIEFARKGGRVNADFIDNSGGVDSSDHEVNIKILMTEIMTGGKHKMSLPARNKLLEEMTQDIASLVLRNNYQQAQAISLMEMQASKNLPEHARFIRGLERNHGIDRNIEGLPDDEEIEKRLQAGKGLTRPELAIIQAYSKILFSKDLVKSNIPDLPIMQDYWLVDYFPVPLRKKYRAEILAHRLHREIASTTMATSLVNRMGPTFVKDLMDKTGASCADVARAYLVVRDAFDLRSFWDSIESLDNKVPAQVQLKAMKSIAGMMERETLWFLTRLGREPDMANDTSHFGKGITTLQQNADTIAPGTLAHDIKQRTQSGINDGLPKDLAHRIAMIPMMGAAFDIIRIATDHKTDLTLTARTYFELGEYFHIDWLRRQAKYMGSDGRWSAEALDGLIEEFHGCQAGLTSQVITHMGKQIKTAWKKGSYGIVDHWIENHCPQAKQLEPLLEEIRSAGTTDIAMLVIAEQRLRNLFGG
ncbi:MAG: NAD-glutamate dehydrogenase [Rhodospirillales bacterium]|nr:NAD-glutamate dehydrogenase [Rhodospirillales bacterium]MCB9996198.1 NAD-glutamate dehydrogenase [Rhodospirillales bacterium]